MGTEWGQFEQLRPAEIEALRDQFPVAYLPWGALEWHGPHNPIGLDGLKAHGLAKSLAQECGGLVLPPVYAGYQTLKLSPGLPHTLEVPEPLVQALAESYLRQLADERFRVVVVLLGHYGAKHVAAIQRAVDHVNESLPGFRAWAFPEWEALGELSESNHAAHGETSLMMALDSESVAMDRLPTDRVPDGTDGIWGRDAREATSEDGLKMIARYVSWTAPRVRDLVKRTMAEAQAS